MGIGTTSPANLLTIQQTSATDPIADAWTVYSSRRWKTNIQTLKNPIGKVQRLRGVSYQWKADGKQDVGLIAEEVGQVIPEVVAYEENGKDAKSVDYARLVAVLIEAVKEQQKEIEALKARVEGVERAAASGRLSVKAGE
ncbi:MAG: tail fiber domain-containing protein [Candidatus Latescibacteria bacterium]|nr:tail fiber domain-containing protein [Candidatus Latescibacterota bacterium]